MTPSPVWIALAALLAGALFATLHLALVDLARAALEEIASLRSRPRASRRVQAILADVPAHARPLGLVRVLCEAVVVLALVAQLALARAAAAPQARDLALGLAIAVPLLWLVNVALASSLAWHVGERAVYSHSHLIRALYLMLTPLRAVARFVDEVVKRLAGVQSSNQSEVLEAELLSVVEEGEREGQLDESEADMIEAVVEFRNLTVEQVMTPRTEVQAFELTNELGAIIRAIRTIGHSRIPVYEGSLDNIVGIFYAKDLMLWLAGDGSRAGPSGTPFDLRSILRPAFFVPETKTVRELLRELLEKKVHIAMVADEYGGTSGLVTIEDIVEEIVGEIRDEYEPEEHPTKEVELKPDQRAAEVDARAYIDDVNDQLGPLGWKIPESDEYDTVGGFINATLGRIAAKGESFRHENAIVTVLEASPQRVLKVKLEVRPPDELPDPTAPAPDAATTPAPDATPARAVSASERPPLPVPSLPPAGHADIHEPPARAARASRPHERRPDEP